MATASSLSSEAVIDHHAAVTMLEKMHHDHSTPRSGRASPGTWDFRLHYGSVSARRQGSRVHIRVFADDDTNLSYVKMEVAARANEMLGSTGGISWSGQDDLPALPVFFRQITVVSSQRISPHMQRIRFRSDNLARYASGGIHIRLLIPPSEREAVWPSIGPDGLVVWPDGEDALTVRIYTIRSIDLEAGTLDVDFVLHPGLDTPAASFAQAASPGQVLGMLGPGGGSVPDCSNLLLLGDDTAIPAISRIIENLPATTTANVFLEVDTEADILPIAAPNVSVKWCFRNGRLAGTAGLLSEVLKDFDGAALPDDLFVWAGCEFSDFREIRRIVRKDWCLPKDRQLIVAYWRRGLNGGDRTSSDD
jgi:NADPH-dependent ferric siderophore reductase